MTAGDGCFLWSDFDGTTDEKEKRTLNRIAQFTPEGEGAHADRLDRPHTYKHVVSLAIAS
jgi:hypothetical protein